MAGESLSETRGRRDLRICFRHLEQIPTSPNHVPALGGCLPIRSHCLGLVLGSGYPPGSPSSALARAPAAAAQIQRAMTHLQSMRSSLFATHATHDR